MSFIVLSYFMSIQVMLECYLKLDGIILFLWKKYLYYLQNHFYLSVWWITGSISELFVNRGNRSIWRTYCRLLKDLLLALCHSQPFGAPILLLSCKPDSNSHEYVCVHDGTVNCRIFLPEAANKWICGSSWGCLVLVNIRGIEVCLYNPLTRAQIQLPSLDSFPELKSGIAEPDNTPQDCFRFITKAIISSNPTSNPDDWLVMAIVGNITPVVLLRTRR